MELPKRFDKKLADIIAAYRNGAVGYVPGGGGRYGKLIPPWNERDMQQY